LAVHHFGGASTKVQIPLKTPKKVVFDINSVQTPVTIGYQFIDHKLQALKLIPISFVIFHVTGLITRVKKINKKKI